MPRLSTALLAASCLSLAAACTHTAYVRDYEADDGSEAFEAICKGRKLSVEDCKAVAEKTCYGPYEVIDVPGTKDRRMRFKCKDGGAAIAAAEKAQAELEARYTCRSADTWFWELPRIVCESDAEVCEFVADRSSEKDCHRKS